MGRTIRIEATNQTRNAKRTTSIALGVLLFQLCDVSVKYRREYLCSIQLPIDNDNSYLPGNVFEGDLILDIKTMALAFDLGTAYKDTSIGC